MTPESAWKPPHQASTEQPVKKIKRRELIKTPPNILSTWVRTQNKSRGTKKKKKKAVVIGS